MENEKNRSETEREENTKIIDDGSSPGIETPLNLSQINRHCI